MRMRLTAHGFDVDLPTGWDARIFCRRPEPTPPAADRAGLTATASPRPVDADLKTETHHPILHAANFPLPEDRGDYGSGAVDVMGRGHLLVVLMEFHPDAAQTALFAAQGRPTRLPHEAFSPNALQRTLPGQAGAQFFFTEAGRAFCLYVALGSYVNRATLAPVAGDMVTRIAIAPR